MGRLVGKVTDFGEELLDKPQGPPATWRAVMEPCTQRMVMLLVKPPWHTSRRGHFTFLTLVLVRKLNPLVFFSWGRVNWGAGRNCMSKAH